MPALPELEVYKKQLMPALSGRAITRVEGRDPRVVRADQAVLEQLLLGTAIQKITRYGKWLIFDVGKPEQLILHLGLTGKIHLLDPAQALPEFSVFELAVDEGVRMVLEDRRKIGKILVQGFADLKSDKHLGPDLLDIGENAFVQLLAHVRRGAHDGLMDQKIIAGIGGKYADEVLWQTGVNPASKLYKLDEVKLREIYQVLQQITAEAIRLDGQAERFPADWLIPHRHTDQICPRCGNALEQRGSVIFCPVDQPA